MVRRLVLLAAAATLAFGADGCSRAAYINKVNEAENLSRKMEEFQKRDKIGRAHV